MTEECLLCGSQGTREIVRERNVTINGLDVVVPEDFATQCDDCGETFYTGAQARVADRKLVDARRRAEGLLASEEIRRLRHALQLSQAELEQAIGTGPKTVVRWENGTAVQSKAAECSAAYRSDPVESAAPRSRSRVRHRGARRTTT